MVGPYDVVGYDNFDIVAKNDDTDLSSTLSSSGFQPKKPETI